MHVLTTKICQYNIGGLYANQSQVGKSASCVALNFSRSQSAVKESRPLFNSRWRGFAGGLSDPLTSTRLLVARGTATLLWSSMQRCSQPGVPWTPSSFGWAATSSTWRRGWTRSSPFPSSKDGWSGSSRGQPTSSSGLTWPPPCSSAWLPSS
jgi:hypothetical protein